MQFGFEHTYAALPARFHAAVSPTPVADPKLVIFNRPLAAELRLDVDAVERDAAEIFSGNRLPDDAKPISMRSRLSARLCTSSATSSSRGAALSGRRSSACA